MERIVVAFENEANCQRIRAVLESGGAFSCICCHSAGEVKRLLAVRQIGVVVCGHKLADSTAERLCEDLPAAVCVLLMAPQGQLDLCGNEELFRLPTPASKGDLLASVSMLTQMSHRMGRLSRLHRSGEEELLLQEAKTLLMERRGMTEEQAHRFIQKKSMDAGSKMAQTARSILDHKLL